ncbi:hypothetical protein [Mesorhizobium sp. 2RAF21]|uniref:hypothetical protein n=1 Tax=Mesorhizobium sp. 2RAF21 TaxID=3232995 RepID=UPI003F97C65C
MSGALETFDRSISSARALNHVVTEAIWHGVSMNRDDATGLSDLFDMVFDQMTETVATVRTIDTARQAQPARRTDTTGKVLLTADERRAQRVENIQIILRDTDYSLIAERYAIPEETIRDILYAMIDAPARVPTFQGIPLTDGMTPVKPINFPPADDEEALKQAEQEKRIARAVDKMTKRKRPDDGSEQPGRTGTDGE